VIEDGGYQSAGVSTGDPIPHPRAGGGRVKVVIFEACRTIYIVQAFQNGCRRAARWVGLCRIP